MQMLHESGCQLQVNTELMEVGVGMSPEVKDDCCQVKAKLMDVDIQVSHQYKTMVAKRCGTIGGRLASVHSSGRQIRVQVKLFLTAESLEHNDRKV